MWCSLHATYSIAVNRVSFSIFYGNMITTQYLLFKCKLWPKYFLFMGKLLIWIFFFSFFTLRTDNIIILILRYS